MGISIASVYFQVGNEDIYNICILSDKEMWISIISVYYQIRNVDIYNICISPDRKWGYL